MTAERRNNKLRSDGSPPLESSITKDILKYLNGLDGCRAVKLHVDPMTKAGEPDIYGGIHGRLFVLEVKRPGNKATPAQVHTMGLWSKAGAVTAVVFSVEDVHILFEVILAGRRL